MKKFFLISIVFIIAIIGIFSIKNVYAAEITSGLYSYIETTNNKIIITKYSGIEKNVIVPSTIDGKKVYAIRTNTFIDNSTINSVTFSEGIEKVEAFTFSNCANLTRVVFPQNMIYISDLFYKKCPKITYDIPNDLTRSESGEYLKLYGLTVSGVFEYDLAVAAITATNEHRKANGLNELQLDSELMEAAMHRAAELSIYYNHMRPNGLDCFTIIENKASGENIYASTMIATGSGIVTSWINSPNHNSQMLESTHNSIGIGVFKTNGRTYAVQIFSDKNSDNTSTKTSKEEGTTKVNVSPSMDIISMNITGFEDSVILKMGEVISPEKVMVYNTTFYNSTVYIEKSDIEWISSNKNIFTVDKNGSITAVNPGTATLTAKLSNATKTFEVGVTAEGVQMSLDKDKYQLNGEGSTVKLKAMLSTGVESTAKWTSSNPNIATVSSDGVVTAKKGGFVHITATNAFGTSQAYIYVCALRTLSNGRRVYPGDLDGNGIFNSIDMAMISDFANSDDLTEDEKAVADINGDGLVNSIDMAFLSDMELYSTFKPGEYVHITSIQLNKTSLTMDKGNTFTLTTSVLPIDNTDNPQLRWTSSNENIATVDSNGKVTAKLPGTVTIRVASTSGASATCTVTVNGTYISIDKVTLNKTSLSLKETEKFSLVASISPTITSDSQDITWTSSDSNVVSVNNSGEITAKKSGEAVITATTVNKKSATCIVTVLQKEVAIESVTLNKTNLTLEAESSETLLATILPTNHTSSSNLTWTSSNNNVAIVNNSGVVTAKEKGSATITVKTVNGKTATCTVTVLQKEIAIENINLNKTTLTLDEGSTEVLTATLLPTNHTDDSNLTWSSSNSSIASVDNNGKIVAKKSGSTTITVTTSNKKSATCIVTVRNTKKNNYISKYSQYTSTVSSDLHESEKWCNLTSYNTETAYYNYDFIDEEGYYNSVYVDEGETTLYWSKLDENKKIVNTLSWPLYFDKNSITDDTLKLLSHPFAGAIYYNKYLYVFYSRPVNGNEYDKSVLALGKYDKTGKRVAIKEYKGINLNTSGYYEQLSSEGTQIPFYGSASSSITVSNGVIAMFFGKNRFDAHESSQLAFFDTEDLAHLSHVNHGEYESDVPLERRRRYTLVAQHRVSHSLGQRIIATSDGGYLIADAGDAGSIREQIGSTTNSNFVATRGLVISKLLDENIEGSDVSMLNRKAKRMFHYSEAGQGKWGNNILNSSIGNIIELSDGYMYIGAMEKELNGDFAKGINAPHQLVVQKFKKDFYNMNSDEDMMLLDTPVRTVTGEKSTTTPVQGTKIYLDGTEKDYGLKFLTSISSHTILLERAIKLDNDDVVIIFEQDEIYESEYGIQVRPSSYETYYMIIDKDANVLVKPTKLNNATMSGEEQYIYKDGCIYWTTTKDYNLVVNELRILDTITSVSFDKKEINLEYGSNTKLNVNINPTDATMDKTLTFSSSNSNVVSVDSSGVITAKYPGEATITVTTTNNKTAQIKVTVTGDVPYIKGDMDQNGSIEIYDVMELLYIVSEKKEKTPLSIKIGDMDNNGDLDIFDVMELLYIYTGKK